MKTLVTGASGFVGRTLVRHLLAHASSSVVAVNRSGAVAYGPRVQVVTIDSLSSTTSWSRALVGVHSVVHLAARVHVMRDAAVDPLAEFRRVNVDGSLQLAREAAQAGVRRFVYVSSIKVNGESTAPGRPFRADDAPRPHDPYGTSKHEAELGLRQLCTATGMELVVVRPPLVYGPGVRANFLSMLRWLKRGVPLPFGAIDNRRSLIALDNLCDLLVTCTRHPAAAGQTFLASDGDDVSTTRLLEQMGQALGQPARLVPLPPWLLTGMFRLLGKREVSQRLLGSLQVDIGPTCERLGWRPPIGLDEGLRRTAAAFLAESAD